MADLYEHVPNPNLDCFETSCGCGHAQKVWIIKGQNLVTDTCKGCGCPRTFRLKMKDAPTLLDETIDRMAGLTDNKKGERKET